MDDAVQYGQIGSDSQPQEIQLSCAILPRSGPSDSSRGGGTVYPQASLPLPPTSRCPNPVSSRSTKHWHIIEKLVRQAQSWHWVRLFFDIGVEGCKKLILSNPRSKLKPSSPLPFPFFRVHQLTTALKTGRSRNQTHHHNVVVRSGQDHELPYLCIAVLVLGGRKVVIMVKHNVLPPGLA